MGRINVDELWWSDPRRDKLIELLGSQIMADGLMLKLWRLSQEFWANGRKLVPKTLFEIIPYSKEVIQSGLANIDEDFVYIRGSKDFHEWRLARKAAGACGGLARKVMRNDSEIKEANSSKLKQTQASTSTSFSLSIKKEEEKPTHTISSSAISDGSKVIALELERCIHVWGDTLRELGIKKDPRSDDHILARLLQKYSKPDQVYHMVRGQRWETGGPTWDVRKHLSLQKVFNDPAKAEKLENLSRSRTESGAVNVDIAMEEAKEYGRQLREERRKLEGLDQLENDGWK